MIALLAAACSPGGHRGNGDDNFFSGFGAFPGGRWLYGDTLTVRADTLRDSIARGRVAVTLRHTAAYRYSNIWLELSVRTDTVPEAPVRTDTVEISLADPYGRWHGKGMGASFMISDTLPDVYTIRQGGFISLRHIMRLDTLDNIEQAGVTFLPVD